MDKQTEKDSDPGEGETEDKVLNEVRVNHWKIVVDEANTAGGNDDEALIHDKRW